MSYLEFCHSKYHQIFKDEVDRGNDERAAQKKAIASSFIEAIESYPDICPSKIWKKIYATHVNRKAKIVGVESEEQVQGIISGNQSWIKSSGHAFEEAIVKLAEEAFAETDIKIVLQRDVTELLKNGKLNNIELDLNYLRDWTEQGVFDLFAIKEINPEDFKLFGCIQSKTSIRDRVTRDREPSVVAMTRFFWSIAIVLDGDFIKNKKFVEMVNGGGKNFETNGWHACYILSECEENDRIVNLDQRFERLREDAIKAADLFMSERQMINPRTTF